LPSLDTLLYVKTYQSWPSVKKSHLGGNLVYVILFVRRASVGAKILNGPETFIKPRLEEMD
jgi:hypothetical protein